MSWLARYKLRDYVKNSIWVLPTLGIVAALVAAPALRRFDNVLGWESTAQPETVRAVLGTLAPAMFTFIVFVSSALLITVQLASAQLSPRIIAVVFRDPVTKGSLVAFVFMFTFSLAALVRIDETVPWLTARLAAYGCLVSLALFLYLIDHVGKALRPSGALRAVAKLGREVIETVYPRSLAHPAAAPTETMLALDGTPTRVVTNVKDGVLLACDIRGLVELAHRAGCVIEMAPQVGDFLAAGDPLFHIYGDGAAISEGTLRSSVAVGQERTLDQDPALVFRIIVDIACKGLSPAINDPTTAVLAIDQIHHLLRKVGGRQLDDDRVRDATGRVRFVYRTPAWEDFVQLAVTEIRHFGGESIQVSRRLRAMLENLIETLPPMRAPLLRQELSLLQRSAERFFPDPEDRALAEESDPQGVGSKS